MEEEFVGAIKIKDGLFIGDEYAAQDFEFIVTNKVTHIINCAGKQIPNYWETVGVHYLTYDWMDSENQIVFDVKGEVVNEIFNFIEEAKKLGEGVLVHSLKGQSRSCCVLTAYFMKRYRWSLYKTLEFLTSRRADLEIRTSFYHQLLALESRLFQNTEHQVTHNWFDAAHEHDHEEHLLRNTFLNARSAPFDEALINPQPNNDPKSRKIDWVDEKHTKGNLVQYFSKETVVARQNKPPANSVKSILKGSNKVFKYHKSKTLGDEVSSSAPIQKTNQSGLRVHKSVRNLSDAAESASAGIAKSGSTANLVNDKTEKVASDKAQGNKDSRSSNMLRSSSAVFADREEATRGAAGKGALAEVNKPSTNPKFNNINGNIIHVTVNNYLAPVNNLNTLEYSSVKDKRSVPLDSSAPKNSVQKYTIDKNNKEPSSAVYDSNRISYSEGNYMSGPTPGVTEKSTLSTSQLKSAIEKKLSNKSQLSAGGNKQTDYQPVMVKHSLNERSSNETKTNKVTKDFNKPADLKPNYQVLLKNRETPPPRKREEAKKINDSPLKKPGSASLSKSAVATSKTTGGDSNLPYSSYLNTLFSTSVSQVNTVTPSGFASNQPERKTPLASKPVPVTYSLNLSQKAQTLARPQRVGSSQSNERTYNSNLGNTMQKAKMLYSSDVPVAMTTTKTNNYVNPSKNIPVKVSYEKIDRPSSATQYRSITPQTNLRRTPGNSNQGLDARMNISDQRTSAPLKSNNKHSKKQSEGSTQELLAKYRQRSSSPSQVGYNTALSHSAMALKSKTKY